MRTQKEASPSPSSATPDTEVLWASLTYGLNSGRVKSRIALVKNYCFG